MRSVPEEGRKFIKAREGLRLTSYVCDAGKLTIGWGHTGPDVKVGMVIDFPAAVKLFDADIKKHSDGLHPYVRRPTNSNQWSALVSLAFNFGYPRIGTSTLVRKFNAGDIQGAADEFLRWKYVDVDPDPNIRDMQESPGLLARRQLERALFLLEPARIV